VNGLSNADILALMTPRARRTTTNLEAAAMAKFMLVKTAQGTIEAQAFKTAEISKFEGKVGTVRRSRKGRTRRNANGRRYYVRNFDLDIVAYKA